jgi:hypothetical protein
VARAYTAETSDATYGRIGVVQSMSRVGSTLDNAAEALNSTVKVELARRRFPPTPLGGRSGISAFCTTAAATPPAADCTVPTADRECLSGYGDLPD